MLKIPCLLMRAGTSKVAFFLKSDLPDAIEKRDTALLRAMGSPDPRQIDGIGGGDTLSSKVAIIEKSDKSNVDINFLFAQVLLDKAHVNTQPNCGNALSGVAPFAIERGLVKATHPETVVRIYNENTGVIITARVQTPNGSMTYQGDTAIDGVPGSSAPIYLNFGNAIGAITGKLFPTGNISDVIDGIELSCVDVSVPVIFIPAEALGKNGNESKAELDKDAALLSRIQKIREQIIPKIGIPPSDIIPKVCLVSKPFGSGNITSRYFTPMNCHAAHAVTGALCISAASKIPGTIPFKYAKVAAEDTNSFIVEHPSGSIGVSIALNPDDTAEFGYHLEKAEFIRTARPLFDGNVLIDDKTMVE